MDLKNKTIIVTGGASGLGEACVRKFHQLGGNLIIADLQTENGNKLALELGERVCFSQTNVCDESSVQKTVDVAWNKFNSLHGVINCAGIGTPGKLVDKELNPLDFSQFKKVIEINLSGTLNVTRLAVASMVKKGLKEAAENGVIINTASVAAFDGQIGQIAYAASKGGIVGMCLPLARELSRYGIRVMTIAPGIFETPMLAGLPQKARESLGMQVPFPPRLGRPSEYAQLAQHIFENEMLNGEVIRLDGAIRMAPK